MKIWGYKLTKYEKTLVSSVCTFLNTQRKRTKSEFLSLVLSISQYFF